MKRIQISLFWLPRLIASIILLQTLYFKFTAAPESVYIFSVLGIEPWGRIGTGLVELVVAILLLIPGTTWIGAIGGIGLMAGAIMSHITTLGVVVQNDGGLLFFLALITLLTCIVTLYQVRVQAIFIMRDRIFKIL